MQSIFESANFGPSAVQRLFAIVKLLPSVVVDVASSSKQAAVAPDWPPRAGFVDYIDCENFLDVVLVEIERVITMIDDLKQIALAGNQFDLGLIELPDNVPMPDAAFLQQIVHTNGLMHRFMRLDPERTGRVSIGLFREQVLCISRPVDGSNQVALSFVDECMSRFRCGRAGDEVSYLDLWATLLSYLVQKDDLSGGPVADHDGYVETNFPIWAQAALLGLKRGLDENRASALVALLGYIQFESSGDGPKGPDTRGVSNDVTGCELPLDLHVPHNGFWALPSVPELASGDHGGIYLTAAKVVRASNSSTAARGVNVVDAGDDLSAAKRKPTMKQLLRPSSTQVPATLQGGGGEPELRYQQTKADLHPVVLMAPLVVAQDEGKLAERASTGRMATYAKSYSRSVGSLDSKLIDAMRGYQRSDEGPEEGRPEVTSASSSLRVAMKADRADDFTTKGRQEVMTCNEIEQLRIAQLVRQHDVLNRIEQEQDLLRKRREKRNLDAQLLTKRDRRQPKKRKPLTVYAEPPERVREPPKKVAIAVPKKERVEHRAAVAPPPQPTASVTVPAAAPVMAIKAVNSPGATVTLSAVIPPKLSPVEQDPVPRSVSRVSTPTALSAVEPVPSEPVSSRVADNNGDNDDEVDDVSADVDDVSRAASWGGDPDPDPDPVEQQDDDDDDDDGADDVADEEAAPDEESVDSVFPSSLGHTAAALRVEAPLVSPSRVTALVTPRVEREEELNREGFESGQMRRNDFDAPVTRMQRPTTADGPAAEEPQDDERYSSSDESTASDQEKLSYAEKRIRILKQKLEEAKSGYHPRRNDEEMAGVAFFPMLFSDDLVYNPCASSCGPLVYTQRRGDGSDLVAAAPHLDVSPRSLVESAPSADDFSDIRRVVDERKAKLQRERLLELYKNSSTAIADEWVSVVRKKGVDWDTYMQQEKGSRVQQTLADSGKTRFRPKANSSPRPITSVNQLQSDGPLPGGHVAAALAAIEAMNASDNGTLMASKEDPGAIANAEEDDFFLRRIENHENRLSKTAAVNSGGSDTAQPTPVPLPFGKVVSGICEIDAAMYFYVSLRDSRLFNVSIRP
jgi:hypothetical protein